jgi:hypothetical protein
LNHSHAFPPVAITPFVVLRAVQSIVLLIIDELRLAALARAFFQTPEDLLVTDGNDPDLFVLFDFTMQTYA